MKKLLYLLLILPLLSISCSSDNDTDADIDTNTNTENYSNSDIVGTWVYDSSVAKEVVTNNDSANQVIKNYIAEDAHSEIKEIYTFTIDGKLNVLVGEDSSFGTYNLSGNKLTLQLEGEDPTTVEISIADNTWFGYKDETERYKIEIKSLISNWEDVVVSKVITTYIHKRK